MGNASMQSLPLDNDTTTNNNNSRSSISIMENGRCGNTGFVSNPLNEDNLIDHGMIRRRYVDDINISKSIVNPGALGNVNINSSSASNLGAFQVFGNEDEFGIIDTPNGLKVQQLFLNAAIISHEQALKFHNISASYGIFHTTGNTVRGGTRKNFICKSLEHAEYWLACGLSSSGRGHYSQYSFPIVPDRLHELYPKTWSNRIQKKQENSLPFSEYKNQVEILQNCLPNGNEAIEILDQIERDIPRTFPEREEFCDVRVKTSLKRVLIAIAAAFPHVDYVQGQNFLAAFLLIHARQDEDIAFCLLRMLMEHPKYKMHEMMMHGLPKLVRLANLLELLVRRHFPKVQQHFDDIGLDTLLYSQNWIQTLFSYAMDFEVLTFVWDIFFEDGWHGFLKICLTLIGEVHGKLIGADFENCVSILRNISSFPSIHLPELAKNFKLTIDDEAIIAESINFDEFRKTI